MNALHSASLWPGVGQYLQVLGGGLFGIGIGIGNGCPVRRSFNVGGE